MLGIQFNNKHSYNDFGLKICNKEIGFPSPNLIYETIPFMNDACKDALMSYLKVRAMDNQIEIKDKILYKY